MNSKGGQNEIVEQNNEENGLIKELHGKIAEQNDKIQQKNQEEIKLKQRITEMTQLLNKAQKKNERIVEQENEITGYKDSIEKLQKEVEILKNEKAAQDDIAKKHELDKATQDVQQTQISDLKQKLEDSSKMLTKAEREAKDKENQLHDSLEKHKKIEEEHKKKLEDQNKEYTKKLGEIEKKYETDLASKQKIIDAIKKKQEEEKKVNVVEEADLLYAKYLIKLHLLKEQMSSEKLIEIMLNKYGNDETISIKELAKIFMKHPCNLPKWDSDILARHIIEPKTKGEITFNPYLEIKVPEVSKKMMQMFNLNYEIPKDQKIAKETLRNTCKVYNIK